MESGPTARGAASNSGGGSPVVPEKQQKPKSEKRKVELPAGAPRFYKVAEVAVMLGMSEMTVYRAIQAGAFPAVRIRGRLIVPAKAVDAMVDEAIADHTVVDAADFVPAAPGAGQAAGVALP